MPGDYSDALFQRINRFRVEQGLYPLIQHSNIRPFSNLRAAEEGYQWMTQKSLDHQRPNGVMVYGTPVVEEFAGKYMYFAECAGGMGTLDPSSMTKEQIVEKAFTQWKNSPGHRKGMLFDNVNYGEVGMFHTIDGRAIMTIFSIAR